MIYLQLFLTFLKIGAVSFGGGYGMLSLIREEVLSHGWLTEEELLNRIAVSESTPGPIAVNMATFIGSSQGGVLGALLATLAVVLPAFVIILLISTVIRNLLQYKGVNAFLVGVRPVVVGLILATAATLLIGQLLGMSMWKDPVSLDVIGAVILAVLIGIRIVYSSIRKKAPSPIIMILISAGLGLLLYPFAA
ncbi:MAG: chromate transporter [Ruminococcaceae bacterium]|nr:chromate transporter [Oscillospiraceae bacterium]